MIDSTRVWLVRIYVQTLKSLVNDISDQIDLPARFGFQDQCLDVFTWNNYIVQGAAVDQIGNASSPMITEVKQL